MFFLGFYKIFQNPAKKYMLKVNNKHQNNFWNMFKVNKIKTSDVVLVFVLLTFNKFHTSFVDFEQANDCWEQLFYKIPVSDCFWC